MLETRTWERRTLDLDWLSQIYIGFFGGEPWNEYLICPRCKPADDFGPNHTWGNAGPPTSCPLCGSNLTPFWSRERLESYLFGRSQNEGFVVYYNNQVAAWQMGYPMSRERFYVDIIAILPEYRKDPGLEAFLVVFKDFVKSKKVEGYQAIVARTHKRARQVRLLFRWLGFHEEQESKEDPERSYWVLNC